MLNNQNMIQNQLLLNQSKLLASKLNSLLANNTNAAATAAVAASILGELPAQLGLVSAIVELLVVLGRILVDIALWLLLCAFILEIACDVYYVISSLWCLLCDFIKMIAL